MRARRIKKVMEPPSTETTTSPTTITTTTTRRRVKKTQDSSSRQCFIVVVALLLLFLLLAMVVVFVSSAMAAFGRLTFQSTTERAVDEMSHSKRSSSTRTINRKISRTNHHQHSKMATDEKMNHEKKKKNILLHENKFKKPFFILHVGPPKTSTTTLQSFLTQYQDTLKDDDHYLYVGRIYDNNGIYYHYQNHSVYENLCNWTCQMGNSHSIYTSKPDGLYKVYTKYANKTKEDGTIMNQDWPFHVDTPECWKEFLNELEGVRKESNHTMNVLISDEMLSIRGWNQQTFHFRMLKDTLSLDWDVRILATYRRFYAWLPSERNHYDQYLLSEFAGLKYMSEWNGDPVKNLWEQIKSGIERKSLHNIMYPYFDDIIKMYSPYFPVDVLNMHNVGIHHHDENDTNSDTTFYPTLASQMICQFIPNAIHTCQRSLLLQDDDDASSKKQLNKGKSGFYDILAMTAYRKGLITQHSVEKYNLTRTYVRSLVQRQQEVIWNSTFLDFPLSCPTEYEVIKLLEQSLKYEEEYYPNFYHDSKYGKTKHVEEFWKYFHEKKYCALDANTAIRDPKWITFFLNLNKGGVASIDNPSSSEDLTSFFAMAWAWLKLSLVGYV